ncbi:MAG: helix-turn-helix transcriptional regulator [Chlamydiae bacterium]|nr:helix-turn-helix transcriptional regulator [Chlamydiota bacterium]
MLWYINDQIPGPGICSAIKKSPKKKGLSQRALGAKVHLPQSHISKMEQGAIDFQLSTLLEVAWALELEVMLVPRQYSMAVKAIEQIARGDEPKPVYQLDDEEEEDV